MELRQLRYFVALASERSFTHAATKLNITQPPLSRQIQQVETEIGTPLIRRGVRPLELTEAGRFFFEQAVQILDRVERAKTATLSIGRSRQHFFGIGFVGSTIYGPLPAIIRQFRESSPNVKISLVEMTTLQQIDALKASRVNVTFGRLEFDSDPEITDIKLLSEPLILAAAHGHHLSRANHLTIEDLVGEPLILYPGNPRPSFADQVLTLFSEAELAPNVVLEVNDVQTALGMVAAGIGVTMVPESVGRIERKDIAYVPVHGEHCHSPIVVRYRSDDRSPLLKEFFKQVLKLSGDDPSLSDFRDAWQQLSPSGSPNNIG